MLTVIIIAKNEELNIKRCLESVKWADEIIVLDSGSTDNTVSVAQTYTQHVYVTDWKGYGIQKQRALMHATGDWVLNLDADEVVDENLRKEILRVMDIQDYDAWRIPIKMCFQDKPLRYSSSPKRHIRLFRRQNAKYSADIVHEKIILPDDANVSKLRNYILHYSFRDVSHALYKINRYSSYSAKIRLAEGKQAGLLRAIAASSWMFLRCYILQFGMLDGRVGFLFSWINAEGAFYRSIKQLYPDSHANTFPLVDISSAESEVITNIAVGQSEDCCGQGHLK